MLLNIFILAAVVGGTLFVCQLLLSFLAVGGAHLDGHGQGFQHAGHHFAGAQHGAAGDPALDANHAADHSPDHSPSSAALVGSLLLGMLDFHAIVAGVTGFGLGGMAAHSVGWTAEACLKAAIITGIGAAFLVACFLEFAERMEDDGTVHLSQAVGAAGVVYLTIPPRGSGMGKVLLTLGNRSIEYAAVTEQADPLPIGRQITVVSVQKPNIVEVAASTHLISTESRS